MANPFLQQVRTRKLIYTALIVTLFTVSLIHRRFVVEAQAYDLQLREVARGEVELTSSAVRLTLTGSSGLANTFLWWAALQKQEKHEWNELELLVRSITKLQPYFVTPWLFQSWNLAYNVSVECDRPRDKYYYITRGIELLAEGERRNQGASTKDDPGSSRFPGNPDMRFNMGVFYQMKIGQSDEKLIMRCLLEMSCIDPIERDPDKAKSRFAAFCKSNPRLVRRLREGLGYATVDKALQFLKENYEVPSRFEKPAGNVEQEFCNLKPDREQFPVVPPRRLDWPDPKSRTFTSDSLDVFVLSRAWWEYAQAPLPDPVADYTVQLTYDPLEKRIPRNMALHLFRGYPCIAQENHAESLGDEGFFDAEGWLIKDWFDKEQGSEEREFRVGAEPTYWSRPAWERAYDMYIEYGTQNGMYIPQARLLALVKKAEEIGKYKDRQFKSQEDVPPELLDAFKAAMQIDSYRKYRGMTNYEARLARAEAEKSRSLSDARKYFFNAERMRRFDDPEKALSLYEAAFPLWIDACFAHPKFARISTIQEDVYELEINYLRLLQKQRTDILKPVTTGLAQMAIWPYQFAMIGNKEQNHPFNLEEMLTTQDKARIIPIRKVRGPFDQTIFYAGPAAQDLKEFLVAWTAGAGFPPFMAYPGQANLMLSTTVFLSDPPEFPWMSFMDGSTVTQVRTRLRLIRDPAKDQPPGR